MVHANYRHVLKYILDGSQIPGPSSSIGDVGGG